MAAKKNNIHVVEMSAYATPEIVEVRNKKWIGYGEDNDFFEYLINRYTKSTTNQSIINGVVNQIFGKGLGALDSKNKPLQYANMISLIKDEDLQRFTTDRKMLGMAAFQVMYKGKKVEKVKHFPMQTLRPEKVNKDGVIEAWFYHPNWEEYKSTDELTRIPVFGSTNQKNTEIYVLQPYTAGYTYFSPVDYQGALPYAVLEEHIGDYLINDTINGFSGTTVINFNNGVPSDEQQRLIKNKVSKSLIGATGEKTIVSFNANKDNQTNVEKLPLDNAPEHYQYLSDECRNKLIIGHRVTSPILIGVRETGGGLGSNADEIKNSATLFDNIVIKPYQNEIINVIDDILAVNDISLKLYFKTIQPLEFIDVDGLDSETKEEETGVEQSKMCSHEFTEHDNEIAEALIELGEDDSDGWELIDECDVDYELEEDLDNLVDELNKPSTDAFKTLSRKPSMFARLKKFATTGVASPNKRSSQDETIDGALYRVRYRYSGSKTPQRQFCQKMMAANKLYRKEDVIAMGSRAVNAGWGVSGADTYSIWLYKGGGSCHHLWRRETYFNISGKAPINSPKSKRISKEKASSEGFKNPVNDSLVGTKPTNMPNNGFVNK